MATLSSLIHRLLLSSAVILFTNCAIAPPLPPSPPSGVIGGIPAAQSRVVLQRQQEVKLSANINNVLPAGEYRAVYGDQTGIYYEAPSKIIEKQALGTMRIPDLPFTGGIFLERADSRVAKIWEKSKIRGDARRPGKVFVPESPIQFALTR